MPQKYTILKSNFDPNIPKTKSHAKSNKNMSLRQFAGKTYKNLDKFVDAENQCHKTQRGVHELITNPIEGIELLESMIMCNKY